MLRTIEENVSRITINAIETVLIFLLLRVAYAPPHSLSKLMSLLPLPAPLPLPEPLLGFPHCIKIKIATNKSQINIELLHKTRRVYHYPLCLILTQSRR